MQLGGHFASHHTQRQTFNHGTFANTCFTHHNRVVFAATAQNIHHQVEFVFTAQDRIKLTVTGLLSHIRAKAPEWCFCGGLQWISRIFVCFSHCGFCRIT
ncbi:Protein of uncharacterised function (DUF3170) [Vibrio cholerae]|uniref:Protein of uncharacterized function (DUF3170) n=1 Tax=Vibrio cholerae TaxID=666 RepID=A0A655WSQ4_VIBCL|nr:Protein of uncharacterised function (DUF3170) [Vibrio cholerae]